MTVHWPEFKWHGSPYPLPPGYEERPEKQPCVTCGKPIQPRQLYIVNGPLHLGCGRERT
jgi:hypothetical protein